MGDRSPALVLAKSRQISSHLSSDVLSNKLPQRPHPSRTGRRRLFWARHLRSAVNALWSVPGLSNFAKSQRRRIVVKLGAVGLVLYDLAALSYVARSPTTRTGLWKTRRRRPRRSRASRLEHFQFSLSFKASQPTHDVNDTMSPTSTPWRCSSTTVIRAGLVCVMDATRQAAPGSPSASVTVHSSPACEMIVHATRRRRRGGADSLAEGAIAASPSSDGRVASRSSPCSTL